MSGPDHPRSIGRDFPGPRHSLVLRAHRLSLLRLGVMIGDSQSSASSPRVFLQTFGCQMNELDSELVESHLSALGYQFISDPDQADVVLYNTCSVREQAENKASSRIGIVGKQKLEGRHVVLGVLGCMAEREGNSMLKRLPQIDFLCGPGDLDKIPMLIDNALKGVVIDEADRVMLQGNRARRSATLQAASDSLEVLDLSRSFDPLRAEAGGRTAYVRITRGCNKFCTYCVVPHTRGAEIHRPPDAIVDECKQLADMGVIEVTLLGQTVNHYRYVHGVALTVAGHEAPQVGPGASAFVNGQNSLGSQRVTSFADLLARIHDEVPAIKRLRFVTSYPRDFGDDVLAVMAQSPRICQYLHIPAQSGSNQVLKRMNRGYTVEQYEQFVQRARHFMPEVSIAGDLIVGFPGETDEDVEATRDLIERVGFKNNFIFKYSPRPGTVAASRFEDEIPDVVKRSRLNSLLATQAEVSRRVHENWVGRRVEVFVEQISEQTRKQQLGALGQSANVTLGWETNPIQLSGRTGGDLITVFDLPAGEAAEALIGSIVEVEVKAASPLLLRGSLVMSPDPTDHALTRTPA